MFTSIVYCESMTDEIRENCRTTRPCFNYLFSLRLVSTFSLSDHRRKVLFNTTSHLGASLLIVCVQQLSHTQISCYYYFLLRPRTISLSDDFYHDVFSYQELVYPMVTLEMVYRLGTTFTTTVWVIVRVHYRTTYCWTNAFPSRTSALPTFTSSCCKLPT